MTPQTKGKSDMGDQPANRPEDTRPPMNLGGGVNALIPQDTNEITRVAHILSKSGEMIPKHFQGNTAMITAAILKGAELNIPPMAALSQIAVINGRPSIWGDAIPALCQRAGHQLHERIEGEGDQMTAICTLKRGDTGQEITETFSVEDAKTAGLWTKPGPWKQYPKRMLKMRARGFAVRDGAADMLMGISVAEEVADIVDMRDVTPSQAAAAPQAAPKDNPAPRSLSDRMGDLVSTDGADAGQDADQQANQSTDEQPQDDGGTGIQDGPTDEELAAAEHRGSQAAQDGIPLRAVPKDLKHDALCQAWIDGHNERSALMADDGGSDA